MGADHHGVEREYSETVKRFLDQIDGTARRQYPSGRMGAEDDGELSYAIANDDRHQTIVVRFGKPVEWIAFDLKSAEQLRDALTERMLALRGLSEV